jgi:hypothetical protein
VRAILVLWAIDHTLIENHGVNKQTYALAFKLLTGREAEHRARTDGRTEPEIMRDMLMLHGIAPAAEHVAGMPEALESATLAEREHQAERRDQAVGVRA